MSTEKSDPVIYDVSPEWAEHAHVDASKYKVRLQKLRDRYTQPMTPEQQSTFVRDLKQLRAEMAKESGGMISP